MSIKVTENKPITYIYKIYLSPHRNHLLEKFVSLSIFATEKNDN